METIKVFFLSTEPLTGAAFISFSFMAKSSSLFWSLSNCFQHKWSRIDLKHVDVDACFEGTLNYKQKHK